MANNPTFLIYGANGYTGELITQMAVARGLKPILGGRNEKALRKLAQKYNLEYDVADLDDTGNLDDMVLSAKVVLHCAGPFSRTAQPMLRSCIKNKTHYLDITGELEVFEYMARKGKRAEEAGIMIMPGVGFDVVPSDCLAAYLKGHLPSATHLMLGFMGVGGGVSHGTATTMLENLDKGGAIRENGLIKAVPLAYKTKQIPFRRKKSNLAVTIPWGDVSTAFYSTKIPNIEVYTATSPGMLRSMKMARRFNWLLKRDFVKRFLQNRVNARPAGPSAKQRAKAKSFLWGQVKDEFGNMAAARLITPEGYTLTALTALHITQKVLEGNAPIGFQTPSTAYGENLIMEIPGVNREDIGVKKKIKVQ